MRWLFYDPLNTDEANGRASILRKIDAWWEAFRDKRDDLDDWFAQRRQWDLPGWMDEHLHAIDPRLMWEFGQLASKEDRFLAITPEAARFLRPMLNEALERAPQNDGWQFFAWRQREDVETARMAVQAKGGREIGSCRFRAAINSQRKIELTMLSPDCDDPTDPTWLTTAFLACESLLGEETLDRWIGPIEVAAPSRKRGLLSLLARGGRAEERSEGLPLDRLADMVDSLADSILEQLPREPLYRRISQATWSVFQLQPDEQDEERAKGDLFVATTATPQIFEAIHGGGIFNSECHSRCGETFCYLQFDAADGFPPGSQFEDRPSVEDALNEALIPQKLGCVIGGGAGTQFSYIDLALVNLSAAAQTIRQTLLNGGFSRQSWLLFFDDELAHEWIGIHPDAPPPPSAKRDDE